jgi:hypothetical protein
MSYRQVLDQLGRPRSLNEESGEIVFTYPAPPERAEGTSVWFHDARVVYVSGYTLKNQDEVLFMPGMVGGILEEEFDGPPVPLNDFGKWWPHSGVVLAGTNAIWPLRQLTSPLGLRDLTYPNSWREPAPGHLVSDYEPWIDDQSVSWMVEDVSLGMAEETARKLGGDLDMICQSGYVRAFRAPSSAILVKKKSDQDMSLILEVGEPPQVFGQGPALSAPSEGWLRLTPSGRVRLGRGKITEIDLNIPDDSLFKALQEVEPAP